ncbi:hypothetical protein GCM10010327_02850 [Streptomyces nitrosporeus]|nr:hypothetical protein GCM10010327_02850 [Streptomyces nitrosporeus]
MASEALKAAVRPSLQVCTSTTAPQSAFLGGAAGSTLQSETADRSPVPNAAVCCFAGRRGHRCPAQVQAVWGRGRLDRWAHRGAGTAHWDYLPRVSAPLMLHPVSNLF